MKTRKMVWLAVVLFVLTDSIARAEKTVPQAQLPSPEIGKFIPQKSSTCSYLLYLPKNYEKNETALADDSISPRVSPAGRHVGDAEELRTAQVH